MIQLIDIKKVEQSSSFTIHHFKDIGIQHGSLFNMILATVQPLCSTDRDQHTVKECWLITQGEGVLTLNNTELSKVSKGQLIFFDSMVSHQLHNPSVDTCLEFVSVWW
ncbi:MAG: hypothetical protein DI539_25570 [Flavobacterium psychrophilum]|nr:MAG: hypothetical protein DI539_25570 [Flavobacterium psychrophilum]